MSKRARTESSSSFYGDESTDSIARNVLQDYLQSDVLRQQDIVESLMGDYPHLSVYASTDRPDLRDIVGQLHSQNTQSTSSKTLLQLNTAQ